MTRSNFCLAALICFALYSVSYGQDQSVSMDVSNDGEFDKDSLGDLYDRVFDRLAFDSSARRQIGLTNEQMAQLNGSYKERATWFEEELMKRYRQLSNPTHEQMMEIRSQVGNAIHLRARAQIERILLPHQIKILDGMAVNRIVDNVGTTELFSSRWLQVELGIDDEQLAKIRQRAEKEAEILRAAIKELKSTFVENVLSELTPDQREKVKELLPESKPEVSKK